MAACGAWLLARDGAALRAVERDVSLVHLLHSLAVLGAARGDLLEAIVAQLEERRPWLGAFEMLGLLDAVAILQAPAADVAPVPLGVGQYALRAALRRVEELLP